MRMMRWKWKKLCNAESCQNILSTENIPILYIVMLKKVGLWVHIHNTTRLQVYIADKRSFYIDCVRAAMYVLCILYLSRFVESRPIFRIIVWCSLLTEKQTNEQTNNRIHRNYNLSVDTRWKKDSIARFFLFFFAVRKKMKRIHAKPYLSLFLSMKASQPFWWERKIGSCHRFFPENLLDKNSVTDY